MHFLSRWWRTTARAAVPILLALGLISGCAQHEMEVPSEAFNRAVGSVDLRLLLLNAVRASKDYPVHFTKISNTLAAAKISGELDPIIPTPFFAARSYDPGVKLSGERGFSNFQIANLNTKEAQEGLKRPISMAELVSYSLSGWPPNIVFTLGIKSWRVSTLLQYELDVRTEDRCYSGGAVDQSDELLCQEVRYWDQECNSAPFNRKIAVFEGREYVFYRNNPLNKCDYGKFQRLNYQLDLAGFHWRGGTEPEKITKIVGGKPVKVDILKKWWRLSTGRASLDELALEEGFKPTPRSAEAMVRYLGKLIAAQNYGSADFVPKVIVNDRVATNLFVVERGRLETGYAAVSVKGPEKEWFMVPAPIYGSEKRDRTLQVMAFVIDFLNSAVSNADIPLVQPVSITTPL